MPPKKKKKKVDYWKIHREVENHMVSIRSNGSTDEYGKYYDKKFREVLKREEGSE